MLRQKGKKEPGDATLARVKKEMAKPRTAKSARIRNGNFCSPPRVDFRALHRMPYKLSQTGVHKGLARFIK
jgi:hypothetical protein